MKILKEMVKSIFKIPYRECSHGEMIERLLTQYPPREKNAVFLEIGIGFTTMKLAKIAQSHQALLYSLDNNEEKIEDLKTRLKGKNENIIFIVGNSHASLLNIAQEHESVHFIFFDSAPSAMHTFREFQRIEKRLKPGACILIDNAAIPGEKSLLTACRKGKILVPYLLASPNWQVFGHPHAGDGMVSAVYMSEPIYADPDYELSGWKDDWEFIGEH